MKEYGLGPVVREHIFGHNGADEGFRARLIAWKDQPYAVVVMVNSDNGSIMQELLLSISNEYGLPGIDPLVREIVTVQSGELRKFVGKYEIQNAGPVDIKISDDQLVVGGEEIDKPITLLPQSGTEFFNSEDGTLFEFEINDGVVVGFEVWGLRAERAD